MERLQRTTQITGERAVKTSSPEFCLDLVEAIPHLRAYARSLTRDRDCADDLVHDAAVRALRAAHQFTPGTNFRAWMFIILRNLYYNQGRKPQSREVPFDEEAITERVTPATQEAAVEFSEFGRTFWQLSEDHREALMLVGAAGFSYGEAAKVCKCALGTIRSRVSRARRDLARLLADGTTDIICRQPAAIVKSEPVAPINSRARSKPLLDEALRGFEEPRAMHRYCQISPSQHSRVDSCPLLTAN